MLNLAMAHWMGLGVPRDLIQAYHWASLSESTGNAEGKELRTAIQRDMTPTQLSKARRSTTLKTSTFPSIQQPKPTRSTSLVP
jgi:TPR repeat protein